MSGSRDAVSGVGTQMMMQSSSFALEKSVVAVSLPALVSSLSGSLVMCLM